MIIDTSVSMEIKRSTVKTIALTAVGLIFLAICVWLIHEGAVAVRGEFTIWIGWVAIIVFSACALLIVRRLFFATAAPLVLTPSGLLYRRASSTEIPWTTVISVSTWTAKGGSLVCLELRPEDFDKLHLTTIVRITRSANRWIAGMDAIYISSSDLDISFSDLLRAVKSYAGAHNPALGSII